MTFLPRADLLALDELEQLADIFIARGVTRIRLTGGEPLVRRDILDLVARLGSRIGYGLEELTLTTNGTRLAGAAAALADAGVRRVNVSLDTLDAGSYARLTRGGRLQDVLAGIEAAQASGLAVKINTVALNGINGEAGIRAMMQWCAERGLGLTLIETMPLGIIEGERTEQFLSLDVVKAQIAEKYTLVPSPERTGGPARYYGVAELGLRLGFITPLSDNFCSGCNRVRITATGTVYGCLGHDQNVELRNLLREGGRPGVDAALDSLLASKPRRHSFDITAADPAVTRHMSVTGG